MQLLCDDVFLSNLVFDESLTPKEETASGLKGYYVSARLDASLADGRALSVSAEGNGKGIDAKTNANTMLTKRMAAELKNAFPDC